MAQYIQKPGGKKQTLESQGFSSLQSAANSGWSPVSAPSTVSSTPVQISNPKPLPITKSVSSPVYTAPRPTSTTKSKATLYGPKNEPKVVEVGSERASDFQKLGWGLALDSYKAPASTTSSVVKYQYGANVLDKKANNAAVNTLYNSYFDRDANQAELDNWGAKGGADTTVKALENFLKGEREKYKVTDPIKPIGTVKSEYESLSTGDEDIVSEVSDPGGASGVSSNVTNQIEALETQVGSLQSQLDTLKADQLASFESDKAKAQTELDASRAEIKRLQDLQKTEIDKADPTKQEFYDQETRILQNQMDAAELASSKLEEDYLKARALTDELSALNVQANAAIQAVKGQTGLAALLNPRINQTIDDWTGRASVIQAAIAGVDNNINLSYHYIDKAQEDLTVRKNEQIDYYNSVIAFYEKLEVSEEKRETLAISDKKEAAQNIIDMKDAEIANLQVTTDAVKKLMLEDPIRTAGAGINLATDDLATISTKLANYDYGQEVIGIKNGMEIDGYEPIPSADGLEESEITRVTDSRGIERIYKNPPVDESEGTWTAIKDARGNVVSKMNNKTGEIVNVDGSDPTAPTGTGLVQDGATGGQCGDYLHKIADNIPTMGDMFEDKMNMGNISTTNYQVGDVLIQETNMPYGHVSIVTAVNGDQATVIESNWKLDKKVGTRTITMGDSNVKGVYRGAQFKELQDEVINESGAALKQAQLAQISNGLLTKGDATELLGQYENDPEFLAQLTEAFNNPKNRTISDAHAAKYNVPSLITKGQFDKIMKVREANGFGNLVFQGQKEKEYNNVMEWLEMKQDLTSIRALKEGGDYIKTLKPEEKQRIFNEYSDKFGVDTVEELDNVGATNTGPVTGRLLGAKEWINAGDDRLIAIDVISGKYKVAFMKEISGVAISQQEAERLGKLVPNIVLQDKRFVASSVDAQDSLDASLNKAAQRFGFNGIDQLRDSTDKTRAGEFYALDTDTLENASTVATEGGQSVEDLRNKYNY